MKCPFDLSQNKLAKFLDSQWKQLLHFMPEDHLLGYGDHLCQGAKPLKIISM